MLSDDQAHFTDTLADETGLDRQVVAAWVLSCNAPAGRGPAAWASWQPTHDYLGPGIGAGFPTATYAGRWWADRLRRYHPKVLNAAPAGALATLREIADDPDLPASNYRRLAANWIAVRRTELEGVSS